MSIAQSIRGRITGIAPPVIALLIALTAWESLTRFMQIPDYLLPAPTVVVQRLTELFPLLVFHVWVTLQEALIGLAMGTFIGVALGVLMTQSRFAEQAIYPIAVTIRSTPFIAIAPILIIWFGFTLFPKAIVAAHATFFPVLVNSITGLRSVDPNALDFFRSVNASNREIFWHLRVPNALPYFFAALRLCVSLSLIGAIVGELAGAQQGIGYFIQAAAENLRTAFVFSAIIVLTAVGIALTELVSAIEARVLYWHETHRTKT